MAQNRKKVALEQVLKFLTEEERKQLEEEISKAPETTKEKPHKATLRFSAPGITVECEVRFHALTSHDLKKRRVIRSKVGDREVQNRQMSHLPMWVDENGERVDWTKVRHIYSDGAITKEVYPKRLPGYKYVWVDEEGKEYDRSQVKHYLVTENGEEVETQEFEQTKVLEPFKVVDRGDVEKVLPEGGYEASPLYEVWSDNAQALYQVAKWLRDNDKALYFREVVLRKSFNEVNFLMYPVFQDGKFGLVMLKWRKILRYNHLMDIPAEGVVIAKPKQRKPQTILEDL